MMRRTALSSNNQTGPKTRNPQSPEVKRKKRRRLLLSSSSFLTRNILCIALSVLCLFYLSRTQVFGGVRNNAGSSSGGISKVDNHVRIAEQKDEQRKESNAAAIENKKGVNNNNEVDSHTPIAKHKDDQQEKEIKVDEKSESDFDAE